MKRIVGLIIINIGLIVALSLTTPYFFTKDNLVVLVDNMALEAVALSGFTLLLISGHFDLSIDGIVALTGIVAGMLMNRGMFWPIAIFIAMLLSVAIGAINGLVVVKARINGLIATLTTWWICVGLSLGMTKAIAPYNFPKEFLFFGQARIEGLRFLVVYAIVAIIVCSVILHYTPIGAHIYAMGDNLEACKMMGINTIKLGIWMYVLVGILSGFIGLMTAARLNAASPVAVDGMALRVIAAIVIGGVKLSGGEGTIIGGLLGLLLMHILGNSIIQLGISPYWQKVMIGGILLVSVLTERLKFQFRSV
jgi:ribose/xylose/arabinose/galactoside ABC-type transport system permease subunit